MKITEKDLIGDISGVPIEVVEKMLEEQERQSNKRDITLLQNYILSGFNLFKDVFGFDFVLSNEGGDFWYEVILRRNFDLFFSLYPKDKFIPGEIVLVWDEDEEVPVKRIFLAKIDRLEYPIICLTDKYEEYFYKNEGDKLMDVMNWKHCRRYQ